MAAGGRPAKAPRGPAPRDPAPLDPAPLDSAGRGGCLEGPRAGDHL